MSKQSEKHDRLQRVVSLVDGERRGKSQTAFAMEQRHHPHPPPPFFWGVAGFLLAEVVLHKKSVLPFCVLPCFYANFTKS